MSRVFLSIVIVLALVAGITGRADPPATQPTAATKPTGRFADEIQRFIEWDRRNSFPRDAVLFVGSSSIRMWPTHEGFPQWPVINRGFGGSEVADVNSYFDQVVLPYHANVIVLYAGDNDIAGGVSAQRVCDDFEEFVRRVRQTQPTTPVVFLSIKPSPSRWEFWPRMQEANRLVRTLCEREPYLIYVDLATPLLDSAGQPRAALFMPDRLHLAKEGYELWVRALTPVIEKLLAP